jgi:signal transduction histidine kinase
VIGLVELLMDGDVTDTRKDLEVVRQEATRAGQIIRNLLAFVRRSTPDRRPEDLNQIVRTTAAVREHHLALQNIALELHLDPRPVISLMNREEIQQIVLNLVLNAEHAIGDVPGAIRIRTEAGTDVHTLTVTDTGPGVKSELRGRIFEPFFTTKDVGQGTGLGLSISLGIATAHGGTLELCQSNVERSGVMHRPAAIALQADGKSVMSTARPEGGGTAPKPGSNAIRAEAGACFKLTLPAFSAAAKSNDTAAATPSAAAQSAQAGMGPA